VLVGIAGVALAFDEVKKTLAVLSDNWEDWRQAAHRGLLDNQGLLGQFVKGRSSS
jgi:hypothetical protein